MSFRLNSNYSLDGIRVNVIIQGKNLANFVNISK